MPLIQGCLGLARKYGRAAKVVATSVLNVVAPGSGTLIEMAGQAIDAAHDVVQQTVQERWEAELRARVQRNEADLDRLGQLLDTLAGPLAAICDKASAFADQPDDLPDIIARAIAANPALSQVLHQVGGLKEQFDVFQGDLKRLADHQQEAIPVYARMNRVADYFDELWQAGITPSVFADCLGHQRAAAIRITQNRTDGLDAMLLELRATTPKAASVCVLEAAAATREFNYPAAQRALKTAIRLKPGDAGLLELSRRVTKLGSGTDHPPPSPPPPGRLKPGDTLDGWLLETRLGAGGWGQVFKATREGESKALKVMHPDFAADRAFVERFKKEIETLIRLPRHAHLVRIEGFGYCPSRQTWYLTMEYVDGPTLEQYLAAKGPLNEGQVRTVFANTIDGLAKAHAAGIVHRDIKPGNLIFRKSDQRLVFVDFGLAVGVEDFGQTKVSGISIQFAAPEQHYGEPATQASDVFSLCAVIHYALHYDKPEVRKPNRFAPGLAPEKLSKALTRGMKVNVEERLRDAGQLLQALVPAAIIAADSQPTASTVDPVAAYIDQCKQQVLEVSALVGCYTEWKHPIEVSARRTSVVNPVAQDVGDVNERESTHFESTRSDNMPATDPVRHKVGDLIETPLTSTLKMRFAWVPPGTSWLGGGSWGGYVKPGQEQFKLAKGLWCGVYPVTQAEWQAIMGDSPSHFKNNPRHPVELVSWDRVQEFVEALNGKQRGGDLLYRLPTEQEWEYICRGGPISRDQSKYNFYFA